MNSRVSVARRKRCCNPYEGPDKPRFSPQGLSQYVINKYSELSPPPYLTMEGVTMELGTH